MAVEVVSKQESLRDIEENNIWQALLEFNVDLDEEVNEKANFLFGGATIVMMFSLNALFSDSVMIVSPFSRLAWFLLFFGSFVSMILTILIVLPRPRLLSDRKRFKSNIFFYKNVARYYSRDEFLTRMKTLPGDKEAVCAAYADQIYSFATHVLPYKFKLLRFAGWTLIYTVLICVLTFLLSSF